MIYHQHMTLLFANIIISKLEISLIQSKTITLLELHIPKYKTILCNFIFFYLSTALIKIINFLE